MKKFLKRVKTITVVVIFWGILTVSFIFFSTLIVLKANGYQLNLKSGRVIKTGMIILDGSPNAKVSFDGKILKKGNFPVRLTNLSQGLYSIDINLSSYQPWQQEIRVNAGEVSIYDNILLFKAEPTLTNAPANLTVADLEKEALNFQTDLQISGTEIYYKKALLTRFSQNVLSASLFPDEHHLVFQVDKQIRVIDLDGSNNRLLFELKESQPSPLSYRQNGNILLYADEGKVLARIIH